MYSSTLLRYLYGHGRKLKSECTHQSKNRIGVGQHVLRIKFDIWVRKLNLRLDNFLANLRDHANLLQSIQLFFELANVGSEGFEPIPIIEEGRKLY